jgi:hypothetical protein
MASLCIQNTVKMKKMQKCENIKFQVNIRKTGPKFFRFIQNRLQNRLFSLTFKKAKNGQTA